MLLSLNDDSYYISVKWIKTKDSKVCVCVAHYEISHLRTPHETFASN